MKKKLNLANGIPEVYLKTSRTISLYLLPLFLLCSQQLSAKTKDAPEDIKVTTDTIIQNCGSIDTVAPIPICHQGIRIELFPTEDGSGAGMAWATDFLMADIGDCTGQDTVQVVTDSITGKTANRIDRMAYSIYRSENYGVFNDSLYVSPFVDPSVRSLKLSCEDIALDGSDGLVTVRIFAEDGAGNRGFCDGFVQVQNNNGACGICGCANIFGKVITESDQRVEKVIIQLSGIFFTPTTSYLTNNDGAYIFNFVKLNKTYQVTPIKDNDDLNGVTTFDLIRIQRHILGSQGLNTPYQLIAADVNNSKSITTLDLIELRKLILRIDRGLKNNTSWRFVDANYRFSDPTNPWMDTFPESIRVNNLIDFENVDFIGIKIGDVNGSATTIEERSTKQNLKIQTPERTLLANQIYTIPIQINQEDITGYQFTLQVKQAELVDVLSSNVQKEHLGLFKDEKKITASYTGPAKGKQFSLLIRPNTSVQLSEILSINSRYTKAEAYNNLDQSLDIELQFTKETDDLNNLSLEQNAPNPFLQGDQSLIRFYVPSEGMVTILVRDLTGRIAKEIKGYAYPGDNQIFIQGCDLPLPGIYFYTLLAGEQSITKRMIVTGR